MRFAILICAFLLLIFTTPVNAKGPKTFRTVEAAPPKSGERFRATALWEKSEELAWKTLTKLGSRGWERRLMMTTLWNETRGHWDKIGDGGCAIGGYQVHVGSIVTRRVGWTPPVTKQRKRSWHKKLSSRRYRCMTDNRRLFGKALRGLTPDDFLEPIANISAALQLMRHRRSQQNAFSALARYAGSAPGGSSARRVWGRHKHWWVTGLGKRIMKRETEEKWQKRKPTSSSAPIASTLILP